MTAPAQRYKLPKATKLCSHTRIERMFGRESSARGALAYPLRAVWQDNVPRTVGAPLQFMITVPKKRLHHAVDRVAMRRKIREAYRLNHGEHEATLAPGRYIDISFIYLADKRLPYHMINKAMNKLLAQIVAVKEL